MIGRKPDTASATFWHPMGKGQMMVLFMVQHRHSPEMCPASPDSSSLLLAHVSAAAAARHGVAIQAEAILDGEHGVVLIAEAADPERVEEFAALFARFGAVQVHPASSTEEAVEWGGCHTVTRSEGGVELAF